MQWPTRAAPPSPRRVCSSRRRHRSGQPTSGGRRRSWCSGKPFCFWDSLGREAGREVLEAGVGLVEIKIHKTGRTVALLADDDLGAALERIPVLVSRPVVSLLSVDDYHQIGVLLDSARVTEVGQLRPL